ncbi:hypothetical protein [uncultured Prevotella sp.]
MSFPLTIHFNSAPCSYVIILLHDYNYRLWIIVWITRTIEI